MTSTPFQIDFAIRAAALPLSERRAQAGRASEGARRALNVAVASLLLVVASPVMAVVALLIKLTSPGPVLFKQARVGLDRRRGPRGGNRRRSQDVGGRLFTIYKFRTMAVQREDPDSEVWARPDDPRVTPIGRVLRLYRLDELPQLWNVIRGDMNLVGPRPEQPRIFSALRDQIDSYHVRQRVRPGITGWAQVNHSYDQSIEDVRRKVAFDLEYVERRRSSFEDLRIMARTIPVMVFRRGAW